MKKRSECHCMCHITFKGKQLAMHCMPCCEPDPIETNPLICAHKRQYVVRDSTWPHWECEDCGKYMGDFD